MNYTVGYFHRKVKEEIDTWPTGLLAHYGRLIALLSEFGPELKMPHSKAMGGGLFELRPHSGEGIGRALYCYIEEKRVVILHAFVKKTQAAPDREIKTARRRMKEVKHG